MSRYLLSILLLLALGSRQSAQAQPYMEPLALLYEPECLPSDRVLDCYPAYGAWTVVQKLRTSYQGSCFRVRRITDNAEMDIGMTGLGFSDVAALMAFCAGTDCHITTLYNQAAGGAPNLTQTETARQPRIVIGGVLVTEGGLPAFRTDGVDDRLVATVSASNTRMWILLTRGISGGAIFGVGEFARFSRDGTGTVWTWRNVDVNGPSINFTGHPSSVFSLITLRVESPSVMKFRRNGAGEITYDPSSHVTTGTGLSVGSRSTNEATAGFGSANFQEIYSFSGSYLLTPAQMVAAETKIGAIRNCLLPLNCLDQLSHGAYAVTRKLRTDYTGTAIRVQESVGSTETDIGFDGSGNLNEAALTAFCPVDCYVVTVYNQGLGTAPNLTAAATARPKIVSGGAIIKVDGKPAALTDGVNDLLASTIGGASGTRVIFYVGRWVSGVGVWGVGTNTYLTSSAGAWTWITPTTTLGGSSSAQSLLTIRAESTSLLKARLNGAEVASLDPNDAISSGTSFGFGGRSGTEATAGQFASAYLQELIIFQGSTVLPVADMTTLEANQAAYYTIP